MGESGMSFRWPGETLAWTSTPEFWRRLVTELTAASSSFHSLPPANALLDPLHSWWRYDEMVPNEPLHFPVVPHRSIGVDCVGCIVPELDGEQVTLKCNECGAGVGNIDAAILNALMQAISDGIMVHKFDELDAPGVLTSISEECQRGECEQCPGIFKREDAGDQAVFCVHSCHNVPEQGVRSIH